MTLEEVETREEITHLPASQRRRAGGASVRSASASSSAGRDESVEPISPLSAVQHVLPGGVTAKHEAVCAEQLTTSSCEERQRFVIKAVRDPRNDKLLSLQVHTGVHTGVYTGVYRLYLPVRWGVAPPHLMYGSLGPVCPRPN